MNNALTENDVADMKAIRDGATNPDGSRRSLRMHELDDCGRRLQGFGLVSSGRGRLELNEAGHIELEERGL